jgi:methionine synthase reductase
MSEAKKLFILYGSQTGNSEEIAMGLAARCTEELKLHNVQCDNLNSTKKIIGDLKNLASLVIIVCSTTGNGDAPENADGFWRAIKIRSVAKDFFKNMPFCVLGLGDTNYDKFCHMGKSIDARMSDLGGKCVKPLTCADEATGLEETVDPFLDDCIDLIKKTCVDDHSESKDM